MPPCVLAKGRGTGPLGRRVCYSTVRASRMDGAGSYPAPPTPYGAANGTGAMTSRAARMGSTNRVCRGPLQPPCI